jgi:hypothetical protein
MLAAAFAVASLSGCASIVTGHNQSLSVTASSETQDVSGAQCSLKNDKGQWFATTPGSVTVRRSYSRLTVDCQSEQLTGSNQVASKTKAMALGNVVFGGLIGVGIDVASGAAYDYPDVVHVSMRGAELPAAPAASDPRPIAAAASLAPATATAPLAPAVPAAPPPSPPPACQRVADRPAGNRDPAREGQRRKGDDRKERLPGPAPRHRPSVSPGCQTGPRLHGTGHRELHRRLREG